MAAPSEWSAWVEATTWTEPDPDPGPDLSPSEWSAWVEATTWTEPDPDPEPEPDPTRSPSEWSAWVEATTGEAPNWGPSEWSDWSEAHVPDAVHAVEYLNTTSGWVALGRSYLLDGGDWWELIEDGTPDPGPDPTPPDSEVLHMWVGAPTHESVVIHTRTDGASVCRLAYGTDEAISSPQYSSYQLPDEWGIVRHTVTGLSPNTRYYFQLTDTPPGHLEGRIGQVGTIKTLATPGTAFGTRKVTIGGCLQTNATYTESLRQAREWGPDWGHFNGDFFYNGHNSLMTPGEWVGRYNSQITGVGPDLQDFLAAGLGAFELVSDHDSTNIDNGDSDIPSAPHELAGWRLSVPHLAGSGDATCRDQQWDDGRVSFFMVDTRSVERSPGLSPDVAGKTMLGAAQLGRLLDWLATNPAPFKVIVSDPPWMGAPDVEAKPDAWWSYGYERQQIIDAIDATSAHVELWHGDSHLIGYATAEKNSWGNFPVLCAAPWYQSGGGRNQNTFTERFNNNGQWAALHGRVTFTDDGSQITRTFEGVDAMAEQVKFTFTTTVDTSP